MNKGVISYLSDKGFGFITVEGLNKGIFFHLNDLKGCSFPDLEVGDNVTFENTIVSEKGICAVEVRLVK